METEVYQRIASQESQNRIYWHENSEGYEVVSEEAQESSYNNIRDSGVLERRTFPEERYKTN